MTLISCILPTTIKRRAWIPLAIECFKAQSYRQTELIVGGGAEVAELLPKDDHRIRFIEIADVNIGAKRNALNHHARGELIAHWDDDDWYAPWRLAEQLGAMLSSKARISGLRALTFYDVPHREFWRYEAPPTSHYVCGATLVYERSLWEENRFEDQRVGEDSRWCHKHQARFAQPIAASICIASTHEGNTCKRTYVAPWWRRLDYYDPPTEALGWVDDVEAISSKVDS